MLSYPNSKTSVMPTTSVVESKTEGEGRTRFEASDVLVGQFLKNIYFSSDRTSTGNASKRVRKS